MRPPFERNFIGIARQVRPSFAAPPGPTPATPTISRVNATPLLTQASTRSHMLKALPLHDANRFRERDPSGNFSRKPIRPKLHARPNIQTPILVSTWD